MTSQKGSAAAMTRQPTGPDAGADEGDPSVAAAGRNNGQLTRSMILQTALSIVDRDGVDGLSMRRLSEAVGRDPVMLYRHVASKAAVLDGVAEMVLAKLSVDSTDPDWAGQLRTVARDFRQLALAHPNVVPLLVTRPLATPLGQRLPGMLRPLEDVLALLTSAGFAGDDALHIYRVLFGYLYGHILNELQEVIERPEETDDVLRLGLHRLALTEFPLLRALAPALASYDGAAELDRFLDLLLPGVTTTLTGRDGQPATVDGDQAPTSRPRPGAV
jgi:AcrR family transcriptional regulator